MGKIVNQQFWDACAGPTTPEIPVNVCRSLGPHLQTGILTKEQHFVLLKWPWTSAGCWNGRHLLPGETVKRQVIAGPRMLKTARWIVVFDPALELRTNLEEGSADWKTGLIWASNRDQYWQGKRQSRNSGNSGLLRFPALEHQTCWPMKLNGCGPSRNDPGIATNEGSVAKSSNEHPNTRRVESAGHRLRQCCLVKYWGQTWMRTWTADVGSISNRAWRRRCGPALGETGIRPLEQDQLRARWSDWGLRFRARDGTGWSACRLHRWKWNPVPRVFRPKQLSSGAGHGLVGVGFRPAGDCGGSARVGSSPPGFPEACAQSGPAPPRALDFLVDTWRCHRRELPTAATRRRTLAAGADWPLGGRNRG